MKVLLSPHYRATTVTLGYSNQQQVPHHTRNQRSCLIHTHGLGRTRYQCHSRPLCMCKDYCLSRNPNPNPFHGQESIGWCCKVVFLCPGLYRPMYFHHFAPHYKSCFCFDSLRHMFCYSSSMIPSHPMRHPQEAGLALTVAPVHPEGVQGCFVFEQEFGHLCLIHSNVLSQSKWRWTLSPKIDSLFFPTVLRRCHFSWQCLQGKKFGSRCSEK